MPADDSISEGQKQFLEEVFPTELREIATRRKTVSGSSIRSLTDVIEAADQAENQLRDAEREVRRAREEHYVARWFHAIRSVPQIRNAESRRTQCRANLQDALNRLKTRARPSTDLGLVGLALSGGGIRSATFNLGVLQVLAKYGVLKRVDYLSTVSGGGYIGSCLSSLLNRKPVSTNWTEFPFRHEPGEEEPVAVKHLRNSGNYLAPGGFVDLVVIPALLLRGILIHLLILLPYLAAAALLSAWLYGPCLGRVDVSASIFWSALDWPAFYRPTVIAVGLLVVWNGLSPLIQLLTIKFPARLLRGILLTVLIVLAYIAATVVLTDLLYGRCLDINPPILQLPSKLWTSLGGSLFIVWLIVLLVVYIRVYPLIRRLATDPPALRHLLERTFAAGLLLLGAVAIWNFVPLAILLLKWYWLGPQPFAWQDVKTGVALFTSLLPFLFAGKASSAIATWRGKAVLYALGLLGPLIVLLIYLRLAAWAVFGGPLFGVEYPGGVWVVVIAVGILAYTRAFVDVNVTSLHSFYRDRLSKAYLFQVLPGCELQPNDEQNLSGLNGDGTTAPYHLINVALNLQGREDPNLRGRNAEHGNEHD